jgi:hypothetical protein
MSDDYTEREKRLIHERDTALVRAESSEDRLRITRGHLEKAEQLYHGFLTERHGAYALTFGELAIGDHFVAFPRIGDNRGHGGLRGKSNLFAKTSQTSAIADSGTAVRREVGGDGLAESTFPNGMFVLAVEVGGR